MADESHDAELHIGEPVILNKEHITDSDSSMDVDPLVKPHPDEAPSTSSALLALEALGFFNCPSPYLVHGLRSKPSRSSHCHIEHFIQSSVSGVTSSPSGEKPLICNICGHGFSRSSGLAAHMTVHTGEKPYACDVCEYKASKRIYLTRHMRTHTGEKPACDVCGYKAANRYCLTTHMRTHTGEKPYKCNDCDHATARKSDLLRHVKSQHE